MSYHTHFEIRLHLIDNDVHILFMFDSNKFICILKKEIFILDNLNRNFVIEDE